MNRALVVLSGGLDSTVCMGLAHREADAVVAVTFDYGQRHRVELDHARAVATHYGDEQLVVRLDASQWGGGPDDRVPMFATLWGSVSAAAEYNDEAVRTCPECGNDQYRQRAIRG